MGSAEQQGRRPRDAAVWVWVLKAPRGLCGARKHHDRVAHAARPRGPCGDRPRVPSDAGRERGPSKAERSHQGRSPPQPEDGSPHAAWTPAVCPHGLGGEMPVFYSNTATSFLLETLAPRREVGTDLLWTHFGSCCRGRGAVRVGTLGLQNSGSPEPGAQRTEAHLRGQRPLGTLQHHSCHPHRRQLSPAPTPPPEEDGAG